jgi:hypothetical protein
MNADNPSAFPMPSKPLPDSYGRAFPESVGDYRGMTLRDYFAIEFAARRYTFELENPKAARGHGDVEMCGVAYSLADAMLEARNKSE